MYYLKLVCRDLRNLISFTYLKNGTTNTQDTFNKEFNNTWEKKLAFQSMD